MQYNTHNAIWPGHNPYTSISYVDLKIAYFIEELLRTHNNNNNAIERIVEHIL